MVTLFILLLFFQNSTAVVSASGQQTYFARIMFDDVMLYKSPVDSADNSNIYFELPKTYFVELVNLVNEDFYEVNYANFHGYVKTDKVQAIRETPKTPYLENVSFRVYAEMSRNLRTEPNTTAGTSSQVAFIPLLCRNLIYYGSIEGECLIEGRTSTWYYCKFTADKDYYGYVYSDFCDEMTPIVTNSEEVTYTTNPDFKPEEIEKTSIPTNDKSVGIIVGILAVPALVFLFMIVKSRNILSKEKVNNKEIIDY